MKGGRYREVYRGHEIVVSRPPDGRKWIWLDDRAKEGFGFNTRQEALTFAESRIARYVENTVAFIWSHENQRYLGISVQENQDEVSTKLVPYGTPYAFASEADARHCLSEDIPWFNSGLDAPQRKDFNLTNCAVVTVELDPSPVIGLEKQG